MSRFGWSSLVSLALFAPLAWADDPIQAPGDSPARSEPGSRPESEAGRAFLQKFEGDWDVHRTFYPPGGEPIRGEGRCRQKMIHGGRFLQSDFQFGTGPTATTGQGLMGFDPQNGRFTSVWTDSRSDRFLFRQSRDPFDGEQIILFSQTLGPEAAPHEARQSRTLARFEDDGRRLVHQQFALEADGGERLTLELRMERRPESTAPEK